MNNKEIREKLKSKDYDFLRTNPLLKDRIAILTLGGSHAYGTEIETSDLDIRGCALETGEQILTGKQFEQVIDHRTDTTVYGLRKLVSMLSQCNPNVIEMLGCEPEDYFTVSEAGKILLDNKDLFLSKAAFRSFGGYASAQLRRLDNKSARVFSQAETEEHICGRLTEMNQISELTFSLQPSLSDDMDMEICVSGTLADVPFRDLYTKLGDLNHTVREYERNSKWNRNAVAHGKICKHAMHLLRLYMMACDILADGQIITRRKKEHDLLMSIRNGRYLTENGQMSPEFFEMVRDYEEKMKIAYQNSQLPVNVDHDKIDRMLIQIYESCVFGR